ncbi:hypothetical protein E8K88_04615 [Lampropedia aestuarii]|uniref:DUF4148 domain-containing protein n=1 Tax=Lampropedia aestuarii TaxID=2562762 RepID=A0A4S5BS94_9BURK|nr:hypothetical protein [Lampropedia aestuarii]MDH5857458.1 hypothetical protein [Lampropedia aestuarii]THJ35279.1 hypothetical protein E8K88_04615 [Lampropedia aestuarii]
MKSFNKILAVVAVSMSTLAGVSAQAAQPWTGDQPRFGDFSDANTGAVNRADVQAQARQAIANNTFSDAKDNRVVVNPQASEASRAQVHAQAVEAMQNNSIAVGE